MISINVITFIFYLFFKSIILISYIFTFDINLFIFVIAFMNSFISLDLIIKDIYKMIIKGIKKGIHKDTNRLATCYFRTCALSSPLRCLTSVFGMGTGVSILPSSPDFL